MAQKSVIEFFKPEKKQVSQPVEPKNSNCNDIFCSALKRKHSQLDSVEQSAQRIDSSSTYDLGPALNRQNSHWDPAEKNNPDTVCQVFCEFKFKNLLASTTK